jgi:hypothetical protein
MGGDLKFGKERQKERENRAGTLKIPGETQTCREHARSQSVIVSFFSPSMMNPNYSRGGWGNATGRYSDPVDSILCCDVYTDFVSRYDPVVIWYIV